ncbi:SDR family oxidoreductase [Hyphomonas sp.]|uniref:SDR family oxidoreductase n=1 Tax=Hyphomonas sp. TaxID=87 RepID=UPI0032EC914F
MYDFKNKIALVTGGGGSIGEALVKALAEAGARIAVADISLERAQLTADKVDGAEAFQVDVTSRASLAAMMDAIHMSLGTVHLVCANAGVNILGDSITERTDEDWNFMMNVNVMGAVRTVDAVLPDLRANRPDSYLLLTASIAGLMVRGHIPLNIYSVSKFAAVGFGQELRAQFQEEGIGISMLLPGMVPSGMLQYSTGLRDRKTVAPIDIDKMVREAPPEHKQFAVSSEDCARIALQGIKAGRFYINTHADAVERIRKHYEDIVADLSVGGVEPGID